MNGWTRLGLLVAWLLDRAQRIACHDHDAFEPAQLCERIGWEEERASEGGEMRENVGEHVEERGGVQTEGENENERGTFASTDLRAGEVCRRAQS